MADHHELISLEQNGRVLTATIEAPPMNVMTMALYRELIALSEEVEAASEEISVMVLRSADPDFFIAHFDLEILLASPVDPERAAEPPTGLNTFHRMCERFRTMPVVSIAEIDGRIGGGGAELAAGLDMRFGSIERMVLNQMEVPLGILPGGTGTQRIPSLVGRGRAMEIILGGVDIDAATAAEWGWLNRAIPAAELRSHVDALARRIGSFPPHAVRAAKAAVLAGLADPTPGMLAEEHLFAGTRLHPAASESMQRFLDLGGQTREGELQLDRIISELHPPS